MKMALRSQPRKGRKISSTSLYLSPLQGWESSATFYPGLVPGATFLRRSAAPTPLNSMLLITGKSTVVVFTDELPILRQDLDAMVVAIGDDQPALRIEFERVRCPEFARRGSSLTNGSEELPVLVEDGDSSHQTGIGHVGMALGHVHIAIAR